MACSKHMENLNDFLDIKVHYVYHGINRCGLVDIPFSKLYAMGYQEFTQFLLTEIPQLSRLEVLNLSFLDDENAYIDLTPRNFHRFVRLSTHSFSESSNPRINIKVVEGSSPVVKSSELQANTNSRETDFASKRSLDFSGADEFRKNYKSPVELDIELKTRELNSKRNEMDMIQRRYNDMLKEYTTQTFTDTSKTVCTKCHLRMGHTKNRCHMDACTSAAICGQIDRHPSEKRELQELAKKKNKLEGECKAIVSEIKVKQKVSTEIQESFEAKVHDILINSNPEKYLTENHRPKEGIILADSYIIKQFYSGRNPDKTILKNDSSLFKTIIESYEEKLKKKPVKNSVTSLLERTGVRMVPESHNTGFVGLPETFQFPGAAFQWASPQNLQYFQPMPFPFTMSHAAYGGKTAPVCTPPPPSMNEEPPPLPPDVSDDELQKSNIN